MNWSAVGDKGGDSMLGLTIAVFSGAVVVLAIVVLRIEEWLRARRPGNR